MILNSDFGKSGTIGIRALPTAEVLNDNNEDLTIFCRDYVSNSQNDFNIKKVVPFGSLSMKALSAIPMFIYKKFPAEDIKVIIFEYFLIQKLKKIDLCEVEIIHCWDYLPNVFKFIKMKNPKIKIIEDMTMAFTVILKDLKKDKFIDTVDFNLTKLEQRSLPFIDYFLFPSNNVADSILKIGINKNSLIQIPYGFDSRKFMPIVDKDYNSKFKIAFAGNINHRKGMSYLINAFKDLNLKNAELNLYGRVYSEIKSELINCEKYNINICGYVDLKKELPKNHIYVHPSLLETTPKTMNEALASGLPVITVSHSGPSFIDGKEGFIINEQSVDELKEKILFFYNNRDKLKKFSKSARKLALKRSWKDYGEDVYKSYKKIIKRS